MKGILVIVLSLWCFLVQAGVIKGEVLDEQNNPIPFASVYVKNSTKGTVTNLKGAFVLDLPSDTYDITFSSVGYKAFEKTISVGKVSVEEVIVILKTANENLGQVTVYSDKKDRAKEIMSEVRKMRSLYNKAIQSYQCKTYLKTTLDRKFQISPDSLPASNENLSHNADMNQFYKRENLNLIENISITNFKKPNKFKEHFIATNDFSETKGSIGESISFGIELGEDDIAIEPEATSNPNLIYQDILSCDFNFYDNQINYPEITIKPLLSPIAETAPLAYKYNLEGSFYEEDKLIYKIRVEPIFITDAVFSGVLFVEDSTWLVRSVDLSVNSVAMHYCKEFHIIQNYEALSKNVVVPVRKEISYVIKQGPDFLIADTRLIHSDYLVNEEVPEQKWTNEIKSYDDDAYSKDSKFWEENRQLQLQEKELKFIENCDSLKAYFSSEEYLTKADSAFNKINIWSILDGVGRRNSFLKQEWYLEGLLSQVVPFGIGGYRHKLPGHYYKEFDNNFKLETDGFIDYGFNNRDFKGQLGVGLTYVPKKFVRTYIKVGDFYEMINDYASVAQTFSRSNYVRNKSYSVAQRMELFNGFFAELSFNYSDQLPLENLQLANWSDKLFGELNTPADFDRYVKSEAVLELKYRIKQKYMFKENKKVILATKYPIATAKYKKGFKNLFGSEVNYDFIELGISHDLKLKRYGTMAWKVKYGTYLNKENLRVLEHKYFRGSDLYFFSNPTGSMQLLGPTLSTENDYFQANFIHHFEGSLLGKVPLINRLKLQVAAGAGMLLIEDENFRHVEAFVGLERVIKLWDELIRLGVYGVTADDNLESAKFTLKFGVSFYNAFSKKWDY